MLVSTVFSRLKMRVTSPPGLTSGGTCIGVLWHPAMSAEKPMHSNVLYSIFSLIVYLVSGEDYLNFVYILEVIVDKRKSPEERGLVMHGGSGEI